MKTPIEHSIDRIRYAKEKKYLEIEAARNFIAGLDIALGFAEEALREQQQKQQQKKIEERKSTNILGRAFATQPDGSVKEVSMSTAKVLRNDKGEIIGGIGGIGGTAGLDIVGRNIDMASTLSEKDKT